MTQRIFDVDNPQDVKDLFDILPNGVKKIYKDTLTNEIDFYDEDGKYIDSCAYIRVDWHGKTLIPRPVDESQWIGNLCWFKDSGGGPESIGILKAINERAKCKYMRADRTSWELCRPARRDEVPFADDAE